MLAPPEMALPPLLGGQRVYICSGAPWKDALDAFHDQAEGPVFRGWKIDPTYRKGDWILTYLATTPRVFLCWEQALLDGTADSRIVVNPHKRVTFDNVVTVDHVEFRTGLTIKENCAFDGDDAQRLWQELNRNLRLPRHWHEPC